MEYTPETPTRQRTIGEFLVTVPQPYVEGHTVTAGEASALNQIVAENLSNNLRKKLADGLTEGEGDGATTRTFTPEEAQAQVDAYLATYEMGVRQQGTGESRVVDPIEREARKLAKEKAKELVKANGRKLSEVNLGEIADAIYDQNIEALTNAARTLVKQLEKARSATADINLEGVSGL